MPHVLAALSETLQEKFSDAAGICEKFNTLLSVFDISIRELSMEIGFETSYLYRIRSGERKPADMTRFVNEVSRFAARHCESAEQRKILAALVGCDVKNLQAADACFHTLCEWFRFGTSEMPDSTDAFLRKLDEFNLEEYIRAIHFDELKVPSSPFQRTPTRTYYGTEAMRRGELDFFKHTVLSKSMEPVFMCSDMPMEEMAQDADFGKKWMYAIAVTLKKGLHLNIIHNLDRPLREMLLGLESWIPLYMTGQISPYHIKTAASGVYRHLNYVSGAAALAGECLTDCHKNGKYTLFGRQVELSYYRQKAKDLLDKAQPLMEIYRASSENAFHAFLEASANETGERRNLLSAPPLYTLQEDLLRAMLVRNNTDMAQMERLLQFAKQERVRAERILCDNAICDEISTLTGAELAQHPIAVALSGIFYEQPIYYTYEEYTAHLRQTQEFADTHNNYRFQINRAHAFHNIQIQTLSGKQVIISKSKTPVIHFVVRHPKMVDALTRFTPPVTESAL